MKGEGKRRPEIKLNLLDENRFFSLSFSTSIPTTSIFHFTTPPLSHSYLLSPLPISELNQLTKLTFLVWFVNPVLNG